MLKHILALTTAAALALAPTFALAQTKVSHLPAGSAVASTDLVPMSQSCSGSPPTATCGATNGVQMSAVKTFTSTAPQFNTFAGQHAVTSITAGATAQVGTGATAVCATGYVCDSLSGAITLTTGTGTLSAGSTAAPDFTVNFADTRTNKPNCVVGPFLVGASSQNSIVHAETTSSVAIASATALAASSTYTSSYVCFGN
ncbi:MAG TPA: hypothetical protein VN694_12330 [Caulobacteraceae bacterium]|nr:hypothetical protein [Caulobacteraceae bacterium]